MISYNELERRYREALKEIDFLRAENERLKKELGIIEETPLFMDAAEKDHVDKFSTPEEKIMLFRSLFKGREDVYAKRWCSKSSGKSGYQPVCENEWVDGICDKHTYKCSNCPGRKLMPLSDNVIFDHLSGKDDYGRDVIGIYPMLEDDTCCFLGSSRKSVGKIKRISVYAAKAALQ